MATKKELREIRTLMGELGERLASLGNEAQEELMEDSADLVEAIKGRALRGWETAREKGQMAAERAREAGRKADEYVHENPWQTAAGAAALGAVLGFLIGSNRR